MSETSLPYSTPLATLLSKLSKFKALAVEKDLANVALAPLVRQLPADQELAALLARFGWQPDAPLSALHPHPAPHPPALGPGGFVCTLDLLGLKAALQKYKYVRLGPLGAGSYGTVSRAVCRESAELVAIKRVAASPGLGPGLADSTLREIATLRELRHDNIVRLKDIIAPPAGGPGGCGGAGAVHLVLECLDCDLRAYLDAYPEASDLRRIKCTLLQVLRGLRHAHTNSIMHRDLKPQNVLVGVAGGRVKLTDFGLARGFLPHEERPYTQRVVTLYYRAPELLLGAQYYSPAVDLWAAGCILAECVNFEPLFRRDCETQMLEAMLDKLGSPPPGARAALPGPWPQELLAAQRPPRPWHQLVPRLAHDPAGLDLLSRLLAWDPRARPTASQALAHPWFAGVVV